MITVVVPVYNVGEKLIDRCISSILAQTYSDYEIIIVDDGSTDESGAVCDKWAQRDFRIKVIHQENKGLSGARNTGIANGKGEYFSFVDSDDWIYPDMYKKLMTSIRANKSELAICGITVANEKTKNNNPWFEEEKVFGKNEAIKMLCEDRLISSHAWNKLFSRKIIWEGLFPEGEIYEDIRVMHEVFDKCDKISIVPECLYYYYKREGSITGKKKIKTLLGNVEALKVRKEYIKKNYPKFEKCIDARIAETITLFEVKNSIEYNDREENGNELIKINKELFSKETKNAVKEYCSNSIKIYYYLLKIFGSKANWIYRHFIMKRTSSYKMWKELS